MAAAGIETAQSEMRNNAIGSRYKEKASAVTMMKTTSWRIAAAGYRTEAASARQGRTVSPREI